uniref:Interleukin-12 subunit alpha n=1 Tax=Cyprinodon variegatus TaxID=28743 RepID=A0A3Q2CFF0_CYPVA
VRQFLCAPLLLLLLQLLAFNCGSSTALPLPLPLGNEKNAQCAQLFKSLLLNVTELLKSEDLCYGLMKSTEVTLRSAETVQACVPSDAQVKRNLNKCLMSIMKDLAYYDAAIETYLESPLYRPEKEVPLLSPTLSIIQNLRKNCSTIVEEGQDSSKEAANLWKNDSYVNRQKMCKMMRGFHVRAITINRAMGYISSGEHRK